MDGVFELCERLSPALKKRALDPLTPRPWTDALPPRCTPEYRRREVAIALTDAQTVGGTLWLPSLEDARTFHAFVICTPYGRRYLDGYGDVFASRGYAMLVVEPRQRDRTQERHFFEVEGERRDMACILSWIRAQEWHAGHICFLGGSMMGMQALAAAGAARLPEHAGAGGKFAVVPVVSCNRLHRVMIPARGGFQDAPLVALELLCKWSYLMFKLIAPQTTHPVEFILRGMLFVDRILRGTYNSLPIGAIDLRIMALSTRAVPSQPNVRLKYLQHAMEPGAMEATSGYWRAHDHIAGPLGDDDGGGHDSRHHDIQVSRWRHAADAAADVAAEANGRVRATFVAGWHDFFLEAQLLDFVAARAAFERAHASRAESQRDRRGPRLIVGAFTHFAVSHWRPVTVAECLRRMREMEMGDEAAREWARSAADNDANAVKPVRIFFIGSSDARGLMANPHESGVWGCYDAWPPSEARVRSLHLACTDARGAAASNGGCLLLTCEEESTAAAPAPAPAPAGQSATAASASPPLRRTKSLPTTGSASNLVSLAGTGARAVALAMRGTIAPVYRRVVPPPIRGVVAGVVSLVMPPSNPFDDEAPGNSFDGTKRTAYVYRPIADPTPLRGGRRFNALDAGSANQASIEARADVAVFTTEPLPSDLWIAGTVSARLHVTLCNARDDRAATAAAPAPEAPLDDAPPPFAPDVPSVPAAEPPRAACAVDLIARVCVIDSAGVSRNICEGVRRLTTLHDGLNADEPIAVEVPAGSVAAVVPAGHRVRLQVCSGAFPVYSRCLGTDAPLSTADEQHAVDQHVAIHYDDAHESALFLPEVDPPQKRDKGAYYPPSCLDAFFRSS